MKAIQIPTAKELVKELEPLGSEGYRKVLRNHGVPEPMFGVKVEDLKKIQKRVKKDHLLAIDLYDTGIYDARYLAGLVADESKMTEMDLRHWLATANCAALCQFTIPWVAAETEYGHELALEWIDAADEHAAIAGWSTLGSLVSIMHSATRRSSSFILRTPLVGPSGPMPRMLRWSWLSAALVGPHRFRRTGNAL